MENKNYILNLHDSVDLMPKDFFPFVGYSTYIDKFKNHFNENPNNALMVNIGMTAYHAALMYVTACAANDFTMTLAEIVKSLR